MNTPALRKAAIRRQSAEIAKTLHMPPSELLDVIALAGLEALATTLQQRGGVEFPLQFSTLGDSAQDGRLVRSAVEIAFNDVIEQVDLKEAVWNEELDSTKAWALSQDPTLRGKIAKYGEAIQSLGEMKGALWAINRVTEEIDRIGKSA